MRALARALRPTAMPDAATLAIAGLLAGILAIGGLALHALHGAPQHVCSIVLPGQTGAIGAFVEFQERLEATRCRRGDVLAVSGDVHLAVLARFCDPLRALTLAAAHAETGRPTGALCTHGGAPRAARGH